MVATTTPIPHPRPLPRLLHIVAAPGLASVDGTVEDTMYRSRVEHIRGERRDQVWGRRVAAEVTVHGCEIGGEVVGGMDCLPGSLGRTCEE